MGMTNIRAWSVLLIRPHVSGDETILQAPDPSLQPTSRCLHPSSKSVRNYLVFFHLSPSGNAGQNQFADSIFSETMTMQTFPCLTRFCLHDFMGDPNGLAFFLLL
jgi:hypothetical protein